MGTAKKIKVYKRSSNKKVKILTTKPRDLTDAQWKTLTQKDEWFSESVAKAKEMYFKTKRME